MRSGLRDVAITVCPAACTCRASARPKPEEQPVMSQTRGRGGVVKVQPGLAEIVVGTDIVYSSCEIVAVEMCQVVGNLIGYDVLES